MTQRVSRPFSEVQTIEKIYKPVGWYTVFTFRIPGALVILKIGNHQKSPPGPLSSYIELAVMFPVAFYGMALFRSNIS